MSPSQVVAEFLAAVRREQTDAALALVSDRFRLVMGGQAGSRFAGMGKGVMATYLASMRPLFERSQGALEVVDMLSNERRVVMLQRQHFTVDGRDTVIRRCSEVLVEAGEIVEIANYGLAGDELDELLERH